MVTLVFVHFTSMFVTAKLQRFDVNHCLIVSSAVVGNEFGCRVYIYDIIVWFFLQKEGL